MPDSNFRCFFCPRIIFSKKKKFVFSCLVLIGWRPSATASKHLFVLPSWKPSSTEIRKWSTTALTEGRFLGPVWSSSSTESPGPDSALPTGLGSRQMRPAWSDDFLFQTGRGPAPWVQAFQERLRSAPSQSCLHPSCFHPSLLHGGGNGPCKEGKETQWPANWDSSSCRRRRGDSTCGRNF